MSRLVIERAPAVWIAKFTNRPHGYADDQTVAALSDFLDEVEGDENVRAVILTGNEPDVFIRHFDVSILLERGRALADRGLSFSADRPVPETALHRSLRRMGSLPVAFIAAMNGTAMGGGLEVALACDFRLVQDGPYDFGLPEINLGLLSGAGGTQRLTRIVGEAKALELTLLGKTLSPAEAAACGLAMECVEGEVMVRALELANIVAAKSQRATASIKQLVRGAADCIPEEGLAKERTLFCDLMVSEEALQAMAAFVSSDGDIRRA
jgi:enoyl-CoA hydratase/carnithine racemase